jgi:hypothetical protein
LTASLLLSLFLPDAGGDEKVTKNQARLTGRAGLLHVRCASRANLFTAQDEDAVLKCSVNGICILLLPSYLLPQYVR